MTMLPLPIFSSAGLVAHLTRPLSKYSDSAVEMRVAAECVVGSALIRRFLVRKWRVLAARKPISHCPSSATDRNRDRLSFHSAHDDRGLSTSKQASKQTATLLFCASI
jgi:hypothetical protein